MPRRILPLLLGLLLWSSAYAEVLKVAALHPILEEWVNELGGDAVDVIGILPAKANLHDFSPTPQDMATLQKMDLIVAMGKNLETYLDSLRENVPESVGILEAGRRVRSLKIDPKLEAFACCPTHTHGAIDPHWWHSPMSARRAVRSIEKELTRRLPDQKKAIEARADEIVTSLEELDQWADSELAVIPPRQRKLVTAHAAFGYFCKEYNFTAVPVAGTKNEGQSTPEFLASTIKLLKKNNIRALFPEMYAGAAPLQALHEATGIPLAPHLYAEFLPQQESDTYESMFRANIQNIVTHLGPPASL